MTAVQKNLSYITYARMPTEKAHGVSIAHMASSFAKQGMHVSLIIPERTNPIEPDVFSYYGVPKNFTIQKISTLDLVSRGYAWSILFLLERLFFLNRLKKISVPPGIVYTREPEIAKRFSKSHSVVLEVHEWHAGVSGFLTARFAKRAALVVCNSKGTEAAVRRAGVTHTIVAPNGFDPELFMHAGKSRKELGLPEGLLALYAGSERRGKGAETVREAAQMSDPTVSIISIGGNEKRVQPTEVPQFLRSADILLLPNTREGESELYTSPIKLFEYLGAGKAIIASDLPSIREIVSDNDVLFVPPADASALARAVSTLSSDTSLRAKLAERSKALAPSYTWDTRARRILDALTAKERVAVYTCILGKADVLHTPKIVPPGWDFICFTDQPFRSDVWQIRHMTPSEKDLTRASRKPKILPHEFLPDYDVSIWIDGNVLVTGDLSELVDTYLSTANHAALQHAASKEIPLNSQKEHVERLLSMEAAGKHQEDADIILRHAEHNTKEGYPDTQGLVWNMMILRRHNAPDVIATDTTWWDEYCHWSKRDQMSFNFAAWKTGLKFNYIPLDALNNPYVRRMNHYLTQRQQLHSYALGALKRIKRFLGII